MIRLLLAVTSKLLLWRQGNLLGGATAETEGEHEEEEDAAHGAGYNSNKESGVGGQRHEKRARSSCSTDDDQEQDQSRVIDNRDSRRRTWVSRYLIDPQNVMQICEFNLHGTRGLYTQERSEF
jgi:hypothetical protein